MRIMRNHVCETKSKFRGPAALELLEVEAMPETYQRLETVLIIEDQEDLNRALALRLEHEGLSVICAYDGIAGLEKARLLEPEVIVLDLRLPRMHGYRLMQLLRQEPDLRDTPIILMTGDQSPELEKNAKAWGIEQVFRKPVKQRELVEAVSRTLAGY